MEEATHEALESLIVKPKKRQAIAFPTDAISGLDCIKIRIHHFTEKSSTSVERHSVLTTKPQFVCRSSLSNQTAKQLQPIKANATANDVQATITTNDPDHLRAMHCHIKFGHQNMDCIIKLASGGKITGIPKRLPDLKHGCPICKICKSQKLPRGPLKDTTELRKGSRTHADFIIVNAESVRMFKSALPVSEAKCRHKWGFTTRSRNPPIQKMRWLVKHLRLLGHPASELRADEDGALAKSTNFVCMCIDDLGLSAQTTGGHNSEANGMVEPPIKPTIRMVCSMSVGAGFEDDLWCFSFNCAVFLSNHVCHRMTDDMPIAKWHDGNFQINARDMLIFGSKACVLTKPQLKCQLQTRSRKDPRQCLSFEIDVEGLPSHVDGFFVG